MYNNILQLRIIIHNTNFNLTIFGLCNFVHLKMGIYVLFE